jgi:hypothetical protein
MRRGTGWRSCSLVPLGRCRSAKSQSVCPLHSPRLRSRAAGAWPERPHPPPARSLVFAPSHPYPGCRPTSAAADRPVWAIFHVSVCHPLVAVHTPLLAGRRLSVAVGLAAFSDSGSSSAPQRLPPRAVPVNRRPLVQSCPSSALVEPPSRTSHAPLTPHTRRVCFAVAQLGASPQASRLDTVHSCRARPCGRRCQRRCSWCVPTEKPPPRPLRPTLAAADRPVWAIFHLVVCRVLSRSTPASSSGGRLSFSVGLAAF